MIFESEQYGGDIEWIMTTNGYQFYEKLGTLIAADDSPDITTYEGMSMPFAVKKNMFEPIDDYFDLSDPMWADMMPYIEANIYEDKLYCVPHCTFASYALNYNRKTFADNNLTDPYELYMNGEWTWDAWRQLMVDFCNIDDNNIGFYATDTIATSFCNTTGKALIDRTPDGKIYNNLNDPDITRAVDFLSELERSGVLYDNRYGSWVAPADWAPISNEILFFGMEPEWTYIAATEKMQNFPGVENDILNTVSDFAFVPFPRDPQADEYYLSQWMFGYMVVKGAKNIEGAIDFIYCNRLYQIDENIRNQVKQDHVNPEKVTYTAGKYEGRQKWEIIWDEQVYDLWQEMLKSDKFSYLIDDLNGFGEEVSAGVCKTIFDSTFGGESFAQLSQINMPIIDTALDEYR